MDTIARGNAAEAAVLLALTQAGITALIPFGGGAPFDIVAVIPDSGELVRIQVKCGRVREGTVRFNSCATDHGRGRIDYRGRADFVAIYVAELDRVFVVPVDECPGYMGTLRLTAARNNQRTRVRLAEDFSFERWRDSVVGGIAEAGPD